MRRWWLLSLTLAVSLTAIGCGNAETDAGAKPETGAKTSDTPNLPDKPTAAPNE